ncbi:MAG: hypothetical protein PHT19_01150 [Methylococcus sp.]|nr:hypothetical protein [Methylococcus sp.]
MGLFAWFSANKEVDLFAKTLAQDIAKRYPPSMDTAQEKRVSANRLTKILEDAYAKAKQFNQEKRLGTYKKAKFGNTFRWELKELGYSKEFIEVATEGLIVYMSRK